MADQLSGAGLAAASDIPSLDRLLNAEALRPALATHGRTQVVAALRGLQPDRHRAAHQPGPRAAA